MDSCDTMTLIVIDNFFEDPFTVREDALNQNYKSFLDGDLIWPGYRSDASELVKEYIIKEIKRLTNEPNLKIGHSSFQYIPEKYNEGSFHVDVPDKYTSIIFLSPNPPDYSGTEVCDDIKDPMSQDYWDKFMPIKRSFIRDGANLQEYDIMRKQSEEKIIPMLKVPNKFNRMLLFDSHLFHRAQRFFGTNIWNSRLTLTSFINYGSAN